MRGYLVALATLIPASQQALLASQPLVSLLRSATALFHKRTSDVFLSLWCDRFVILA